MFCRKIILAWLVVTINAISAQNNRPIFKLFGNWETYLEMSKFLSYSIQKFDDGISCHTIIWDYELSCVVDYMNFCNDEVCIPKYLHQFDGNFSEDFTKSIKVSYKQQCQSYIFLLSKSTDVIQLLHYGDEFRTIDTHARFLIWYGQEDKVFEADDIWRKLPNVVFFHTKLNRRPSRRKTISFKVLSVKWPIMPNSTESATGIMDFWRNGRLAKDEDSWFRDKTNNLRNLTLKCLTVEHPPSIIKYRSLDGYIEYAGTEMEVLKELAIIMNFNFDILDADPMTKWGGVSIENGSEFLYGAVARLANDEVDMALGSFIVLTKNLEYLDMSIPLDVACTSFLVANPLPRPRFLALILPFQLSLWILVVTICLIFAPLAFYLLAKLPLHAMEYRMFATKWNSIITSISIMSQVALHVWPKFWPIRLLIGWYWIFCLLITLAYRCAMVSFLTIPLFEPTIDNLKDLANSKFRVGGWGPGLKNLFTQEIKSDDANDDKARQYLSGIYELVPDYDTGLNLVAERKFAMYENVRYLKFMLRTRNVSKIGSPTMRVMKQCILPVHIGIAYQWNSPIAPKINTHIRRFQESGLMRKWSQRLIAKTKKYFQDKLEASSTTDDEQNEDDSESEESEAEVAAASGSTKERKQRVLSMRDLQGPIYLIIFGISISIIAFLVELFTNRSKVKRKLLTQIPSRFPRGTSFDVFTKISEKALKVKTDRELKAILREMGKLPKRKDKLKRLVKRKVREIRNFHRKDEMIFPYIE